MSDRSSRREFLKNTAVAGVATAAISPLSSFAGGEPTASKSRVVVVKDEASITGGKADAAKVQDMIDYGIIALTGKSQKGAAYEALFPKAVTASTKILLKRNDISGKGAVNGVVVEAIKKGLTSMLNGSFSASNITIQHKNESVLSKIESHDYIINCPVAWCHGSDYGVTLSLKNTMGYLAAPSNVHSTAKTWLHTNSLDNRVKPKQILSIMDALVGNNKTGPGSAATFTASTIIISKDLVAVDHNTIALMEQQSGANTAQLTTGKNQLKAAETAGLGTCTPDKMEIINLKPPFTTGVIGDSETLKNSLNINIANKNHQVEFTMPHAALNHTEITIFDMMGKLVWRTSEISSNCIIWNKKSVYGTAVPAGVYVYHLRNNNAKIKGTLMIS